MMVVRKHRRKGKEETKAEGGEGKPCFTTTPLSVRLPSSFGFSHSLSSSSAFRETTFHTPDSTQDYYVSSSGLSPSIVGSPLLLPPHSYVISSSAPFATCTPMEKNEARLFLPELPTPSAALRMPKEASAGQGGMLFSFLPHTSAEDGTRNDEWREAGARTTDEEKVEEEEKKTSSAVSLSDTKM